MAEEYGEEDESVIRKRCVRVNFNLLDLLSKSKGGVVNLNLFEDVQFTTNLHTLTPGSEGRDIWHGTLQEISDGTVILVVDNDLIVGTVRAPGIGFYKIVFLGANKHSIREIDENKLPPCSGGIPSPVRDRLEEDPDNGASKGIDDGSVSDVLVVYTEAARDAAGGVSGMHAAIDLAIEESNLGYDDSNVIPDMNLICVAEESYSETGDKYGDDNNLLSRYGYNRSVNAYQSVEIVIKLKE